jgi:hydroxymethylpyrimidine pyrophosphatase-like HAD family hydrolase
MLDEYLDEEKSYERLKEEFLLHGKLIIAYDLDSTVYDYHHKNVSYEMVKDLIRKYRNFAYFIVFTSSEPDRYEEIKQILNKENLPYDSINEDAPFIPFKGRKVYYNILLDDRAGLKQTYKELLRLYNEVITKNDK